MSLFEEQILHEVEDLIQKKHFREAKETLSSMEPIDIAEGLEELPPARLVLYFRLLPKDLAIEVFELLDIEVQERFVNNASDGE